MRAGNSMASSKPQRRVHAWHTVGPSTLAPAGMRALVLLAVLKAACSLPFFCHSKVQLAIGIASFHKQEAAYKWTTKLVNAMLAWILRARCESSGQGMQHSACTAPLALCGHHRLCVVLYLCCAWRASWPSQQQQLCGRLCGREELS
jgi:hypothetical protein